MTFIIDTPRFTNGGTIVGGLTMGDGANYLDNRKGVISGKINMLGGNDKVRGGKRGEYIDGGDGNDNLNGGLGNDKLIGGAGIDTLIGGSGKDTFMFVAEPIAQNMDIIRDFSSKDDTFKISQAFFTNIGGRGRLAKDAFHLGKAAADAEDRIIYHKSTGNLYYDPDGNGPEAQVQIARLTNKAKLALSDFMVI